MCSDKSRKIKICGMRTLSDIQIVNEALPEFCGFIFDPSRRRYVEPGKAEELRQNVDPRIRTVGVFVNASEQEITDVLDICPVDAVQLHGAETNVFIKGLRERFLELPGLSEVQIIKAFRIDSGDDVRAAEQSEADLILLDHGIGGTGEKFDWSLIRDCGRPFILAGGLSADNVGEAIRLADPWGVDVSSSLETDGHKDRRKVLDFVKEVRGSETV